MIVAITSLHPLRPKKRMRKEQDYFEVWFSKGGDALERFELTMETKYNLQQAKGAFMMCFRKKLPKLKGKN